MPRGERLPRKGPGRPKGSQNKMTMALKDMILKSLAMVGGEQYLAERAGDNPAAYLSLVGRVLPLQVKASDQEPTVPKPVYHDKIA